MLSYFLNLKTSNIINDHVLHETRPFNNNESISEVWWHSKEKTHAWDPITGIYLGTLKSSTCNTFFGKTSIIDGVSWSTEGQDSVVLGLLLTLHRSNYSGIKTMAKLRSSTKTTNVEGGETTTIFKINKVKQNTKIKKRQRRHHHYNTQNYTLENKKINHIERVSAKNKIHVVEKN